MKFNTGYRESASALIVLSLSPSLLFLIGSNSSALGSGAWINCLIYFLLSLIILPLGYVYLSFFDCKNIAATFKDEFGVIAGTVVSVVILSFFIVICAFLFKEYHSSLMSMTSQRLNGDFLALFLCVVSTVCAYLGLESLTRQSYITLVISYVILFVLFAITFGGFNTDNFMPVFGTDIKKVATNYACIATNVGLLPFFVICDLIKKENHAKRCIRRTVFFSHGISLLLFLLYTAAVPYPMGDLFDTSLGAVFASASSGEVMHRFDVFLVALYMLFFVVSTSTLISVSSRVCKIAFGGDCGIYVLLISSLVYNLSGFDLNSSVCSLLCVILFVFSLCLLVLPVLKKILNNRKMQEGASDC